MVREILPSELWEKIEPVIAERDPRSRTGRPRVPDRAVLRGILFVLKTGIQWEYLPQRDDMLASAEAVERSGDLGTGSPHPPR